VIAAGEDDAFHAREPGGLENVEQPACIGAKEVVQGVAAGNAGKMHHRSHATHHALDGRAVCYVGYNEVLVGGNVVCRPDVRQPQMAPSVAQTNAQSGADRAGGSSDQHAVGFRIDHRKLGITSEASSSSVSASFL
jgi:hypothetical protein